MVSFDRAYATSFKRSVAKESGYFTTQSVIYIAYLSRTGPMW